MGILVLINTSKRVKKLLAINSLISIGYMMAYYITSVNLTR